MSRGTEVVVAAPAKINLCLGVGAPRGDGFHPLATVYQAIGLYDDVTVRGSDQDRVTVSGEGVDVSEVPRDGSNLALRAVRLLAEHHGIDEPVEVHLHKRIPVAGGMAGGSTDAAGALVACDALWGTATPRQELLDLAAELGSDVPFCVVGGTALGSGRGELVTPVMTRGAYWWVIVTAEGGLSTAAVYAEFDRHAALSGGTVPEPHVPEQLLAGLTAGDVERVGEQLENDLMPAALSLRPDLARTLTAGLGASAHGALVSGSGPTTVFLCTSEGHAHHVDDQLRRELGTPPAILAKAPVHGARVVAHRPVSRAR